MRLAHNAPVDTMCISEYTMRIPRQMTKTHHCTYVLAERQTLCTRMVSYVEICLAIVNTILDLFGGAFSGVDQFKLCGLG
jgi:hypothetical protein